MKRTDNPCDHLHGETADYNCFDCGMDTNRKNEYYMVTDKVWKKAKVPPRAMLCIGCLEHRIGRLLNHLDFPEVPINFFPIIPRSRRLHDRLKVPT